MESRLVCIISGDKVNVDNLFFTMWGDYFEQENRNVQRNYKCLFRYGF